MSSTEDMQEKGGTATPPPTSRQRIRNFMKTDVLVSACNPVSIYMCFLTGYTSCISFSACFVWCGFQTGNVAQLGLALARTFNPEPEQTHYIQKPDQQAICSLLSFLIGAGLGRIGDRMGAKGRSWLALATFFQALLSMAGALTAHYGGESAFAGSRADPSWTGALSFASLGFISATLGLQGIMGKRIGSPMNTTVVLTTTWVEIMNDPFLIALKYVPSRDIRVMGVLALFFGAFVARALLGKIASAGTIGVLAGLRIVQLVMWLIVPSAKPKP